MKRTIIVVAILLLCHNGFSQSLNFKDMLDLYSKQDIKTFLTFRSFFPVEKDANHVMYIKNLGTKTTERIVCNERVISYTTPNIGYVQAIMNQLPKQFTLVSKNVQDMDTFLRFQSNELMVMIDITKTPAAFSSISISKKR